MKWILRLPTVPLALLIDLCTLIFVGIASCSAML